MAEQKQQVELIGSDAPVPRKSAVTKMAPEIDRSPEALIAQALGAGQSVETIERLLAMRRELRAEWARDQFFASLSEFQAQMPKIAKTKAVADKNGKVRYHYAPLDEIIEAVRPALERNGFSYTMKPVQEEAGSFTARLIAHHRDGHEEETAFTVPIDPEAYMSAPQKVGSARTFAMRYAFCNAWGILTSDEDDDAPGFEAGVKYADYVHAIEAETTLESLKATGKRLHDELQKAGDAEGAKVVLAVYNRRKGELS